MKEIFMGLVKM